MTADEMERFEKDTLQRGETEGRKGGPASEPEVGREERDDARVTPVVPNPD